MNKLAVIAIGGNSLIKDKEHQKVEDQYVAICETVKHIVGMIEKGYNVVVTHGNGPQVGFLLQRSEIAYEVAAIHQIPLVSCGADTQGAIGYQIQQALDNEFTKRGINKSAVSIVTQVIVDKQDEAFAKPSKPIGSFYTEAQAEVIKRKNPEWVFVSDAGRGYRRVVPSPAPQEIVEKDAIKKLVQEGYCVISVGGGGIPVIRGAEGFLSGVDAVIDKDFATSLLAAEIKADLLIVSTGVEQVCVHYGQPNEHALNTMTIAEAERYMADGEFAPGSMLPKIQAVIRFLKNGGKHAIITNPESLERAIAGLTGTHICA